MTLTAVARTSYGQGRYRGDGDTGEGDVIWGTCDTWSQSQHDGILVCHGSSADALSTSFGDGYVTAFNRALALGHTLCMPDLAGPHTFGNDGSMDAADDAVDYMVASWGVTEPVTVLGISMGGATALNYAKRHPSRVKALALLMPATDIDYLHTHAFAPIPSYIDEGYAGGWSQATYGADHNPITFVNDLPSNLPIHIWYAPDDPLIPTSMPLAFQAARPQTGLTLLPNGGHTSFSQYNALPSVLDWLASL